MLCDSVSVFVPAASSRWCVLDRMDTMRVQYLVSVTFHISTHDTKNTPITYGSNHSEKEEREWRMIYEYNTSLTTVFDFSCLWRIGLNWTGWDNSDSDSTLYRCE